MIRRLQEKTPANFVPVHFLEAKSKSTQPKIYNPKQEDSIRRLMEETENYAESGPTFDPEGRYLCGSCIYRSDDSDRTDCAVLDEHVSNIHGSCHQYYRGSALGKKLDFFPKGTYEETGYGERPKSKGFGCARCGMAEKANKTDSKGRTLWCNGFHCHVQSRACCRQESGPDLITPGSKE